MRKGKLDDKKFKSEIPLLTHEESYKYLGICESSENLDDNSDSKQTDSSSSEDKSPILKPPSENSTNVSPELNNTNVKDSIPSVRSQPPSSAPSPLLDRDEPLW